MCTRVFCTHPSHFSLLDTIQTSLCPITFNIGCIEFSHWDKCQASGQLGTLHVIPCERYIDNTFYSITFKLQTYCLYVVGDIEESQLILDHYVNGQDQFSHYVFDTLWVIHPTDFD